MASPLGNVGPVLEFGPFTLDTRLGALFRDGEPVKLSAQPAQVLGLLARRTGSLVTREEIQEALWSDDTFVDFEHGINTCVKQIRTVLGDSAEKPLYIETVPRHGYRFLVSVRTRPDPRKRRRSAVLATIVVGSSIAFLSHFLLRSTPETSDEPIRVVVLPFDNLGRPDDAYLASGMTEEIANLLAEAQGVSVLSRTTARIVKDSPRTAREIGDTLAVEYVLEGSLQWHGREGRIHAALVRTRDEARIWTRNYERTVEDLFAVESDIAREVLRTLRVTPEESDGGALADRPTGSVEAYNAYFAGLHYWEGIDRDVDWRLAADLFAKAVEIDPEFAHAWAASSEVSSYVFQQGFDRSTVRRRLAEDAAREAERLTPDDPRATAARANVFRRIYRDYDAAYETLSRLAHERPNDLFLQDRLSPITERRGDWHETLRVRRRVFELDPNMGDGAWGVARCLRQLRRYDEAEQILRRGIRDRPDWTFAHAQLARIQRLGGNLAEARRTLEAMPRSDLPLPITVRVWFEQRMAEREFAALLEMLSADPRTWFETDSFAVPKSLMEALARLEAEDGEGAGVAFASAAGELERRIEQHGGDHRLESALGLAYAGLGRGEEAIREATKGWKGMPVELDALVGPWRIEDLAHVYAIVGEEELALERIAELLEIPAAFSLASLELDPRWDSLRGHPHYRELLRKHR